MRLLLLSGTSATAGAARRFAGGRAVEGSTAVASLLLDDRCLVDDSTGCSVTTVAALAVWRFLGVCLVGCSVD